MFFYKYVKLVILASVLCIGYISAVNYTNQIKHNTKVSSAELKRPLKKRSTKSCRCIGSASSRRLESSLLVRVRWRMPVEMRVSSSLRASSSGASRPEIASMGLA